MLKKFATDLSRGLRTMVRGLDADWDFSERRRTIRFNSRYKVEILRAEENKVAYVINYSMGGLRFTTTQKYKPGEQLSVNFPLPIEGVSVSKVACEVVFVRKNPKTLETVVGVKFKETKQRMANSWVAYLFREKNAESKDLIESRKVFRTNCRLEVLARGVGDNRGSGQVINISTQGACIVIDKPAETEDIWGLDIKGLSNLQAMHIKVTVLDCEEEAAGLYRQRVSFNSPLDEMTQSLLVSYMQHLAKDFWTEA